MSEVPLKDYLGLNEKQFSYLNKMTKKELMSIICASTLRGKVQDECIEKLEREADTLNTKLDKAESYVEQGRSMISAVMDRWYEYDT